MKIEKINLIGFGKFDNKNLNLEEEMNIIYGENEAGKTTIHNFINGIFYGFLRPYVKKTLYTEEHEKYYPWNGNRYSGTLDFSKDNIKYRIEREFTRGNEKTSVFLRDTGEDITKKIEKSGTGRVIQPGFHFFGFNDAVYNNTISIKQLESKTEETLANEVRDKLANISTSLDEDISVENAVENLNQKIKNIGTERATTSPYGKSFIKIESLKQKRRELYIDNREYEDLLIKNREINNKLIEKEENIRIINEKLNLAIKYEKKKIYDDVENIKKEIEELKKDLEELSPYKDISIEEYTYTLEITRDLENTKMRIKELNEEIKIIEEEIKLYGDNTEIEDIESNYLIADYFKVEELDEEKNKLELEEKTINIEYLEREYEDVKVGGKNKLYPIIILILISTIILSIFTKNLYILLINLLIFPILFLNKNEESKTKEKSEVILRELKILKENRKNISLRIEEINKIEKIIFEKYNVNSKIELKRQVDILEFEKIQKKSQISEYENRRNRIIRGNESLEILNISLNSLLQRIDKLLLKNNSKDIEEFKKALDKKTEYEEIKNKIENKIELKNNRLGEEDIEQIKKDINNIDFSEYKYEETSGELKEIFTVEKDILNDIKIEQNIIEEKINILNKGVKDLLEIEESIENLENDILNMDKEKKAIELAKETILNVSKDIHQEFAPTINKRVGEIVNKITNNKYEKVKIDDKLNIGVIEPETKEIVNINSLSGGTIDQLYFALRYGIIDEIKNGSLPLILDDCFIQYDDMRLEKMIDFLIEESKKRQIILFTCNNREIELLKNKKENVNIIRL